MHGDAFDILETALPDSIGEFVVYFIGIFFKPNKYPVMECIKRTTGINKSIGELEEAITNPNHNLEASGGAIQVTPETALPPFVCQEIRSPGETDNPYFQKVYRSIDIAR